MSTVAATTPAPFDEALLARIEDAGINASAPREQRWALRSRNDASEEQQAHLRTLLAPTPAPAKQVAPASSGK